jgi:hypothetical protein
MHAYIFHSYFILRRVPAGTKSRNVFPSGYPDIWVHRAESYYLFNSIKDMVCR